MSERIVKTCGCGQSFTAHTWKLLTRVGVQHDRIEKIELRNCPRCRSTLAVLKTQYVREPSPALLDTLAKRIGYGGKKGSAARRKMLRAAPHELARRFPS